MEKGNNTDEGDFSENLKILKFSEISDLKSFELF